MKFPCFPLVFSGYRSLVLAAALLPVQLTAETSAADSPVPAERSGGKIRPAQKLALPAIFSNSMVLQRDKPVKVWGWDLPGQLVTVEFAGQTRQSQADIAGAWAVELEPLAGSSEGHNLVITGSERKIFEDVVVGEVWICSGQSNMSWTVAKTDNAEQVIRDSADPDIRLFKVPNTVASELQSNFGGDWKKASPQTTGEFSAVAYYFAKNIRPEIKVPVGLISTNWGGTRVEAWTSAEKLESLPAAQPILEEWRRRRQGYSEESAAEAHREALAKWKEQTEKINAQNETRKAAGQPVRNLPRKPALEADPASSQHQPSVLFNGMISPAVGYGVRGVLWYQGESNAGRAIQYRALFPALIEDWRAQWGEELPFYFVQLANHLKDENNPGSTEPWVELQEAQALTLKLPATGMAVINDIGVENDVHPRNKADVGARLSRWALRDLYGKSDLVPSGPIYASSQVEGDSVRVEFTFPEGLKSADGNALARFVIAGEDRKFVPATAEISVDHLVVRAEGVSKPVAVRYAWDSNPKGANLTNATGLPASCFRTDDWPVSTTDKTAP